MRDDFADVDNLLVCVRVDSNYVNFCLVTLLFGSLVVANDFTVSDKIMIRTNDLFTELSFRNHFFISFSQSGVGVAGTEVRLLRFG